MGSYLTIKPARKDSDDQERNHNFYRKSNRDDYTRDQDGYPERRERRVSRRYYHYNSPNRKPEIEQYPCRYKYIYQTFCICLISKVLGFFGRRDNL